MKRYRILVIEDDDAIRQGIVDALECEGYVAVPASDAVDGMAAALGAAYDLLLLDLVLPGGDGFDILDQVRAARPAVPVIILTARGEEGDRVRGLKLGADDYVVKPFSVRELLARVEAVLRRTPIGAAPKTGSRVEFRGGFADLTASTLHFVGGESDELSERETDLLRYFAANAGRPISREEILSRVWGITARGMETRTIDMHIARLREKLRDDADRPRIITTVRGKGYLFEKRKK